MDKRYYFLIFLFFVLSMGLLSYFVYSYLNIEKQREAEIYTNVQTQAVETAERIDSYISSKVLKLNDLSAKLSSTKNVDGLVEEFLKKNPFFRSISIAYLPNKYKPNVKLYGINFLLIDGKLDKKFIQDYYNYTISDWFTNTLLNQGVHYSLPAYNAMTNKTFFRIAMPFFENGHKNPIGVMSGNTPVGSLDDFIGLVRSENAQAFIFNKNGALLAHPVDQYAKDLKKLEDVGLITGDPGWKQLSNLVKKQTKGVVVFKNKTTKQEYMAAFTPLKMPGYFVCVKTLFKGPEVLSHYEHMYIHIALALAFFIFMLVLALMSIFFEFNQIVAWFFAILFSILCVSVISVILYIDYNSMKIEKRDKQEIIYTKELLDTFLKINQKLRGVLYEKQIPLGLFIESISISDKGEITTKGLIWQKLDKLKDGEYELESNANMTFTPAYKSLDGNNLTKGWFFVAKNSFSGYMKYPLDQHLITLSFLPKNYVEPVVFVPDFDSFTYGDTIAASVLSPKIKTLGWKIFSGYFAYSLTNFPTELGLENFSKKRNFPTLQFTILLRRHFVYPLFSGFISILVCLLIIFIVLLSSAKTATLTRIISIFSSLFFAIILAHQRLKGALPEVNEISYLEIFYFLTFIVITLATIDIVMYINGKDNSIIHRTDNWLSIILYWPLISFAFLIITLAVFY